LLVAGAEVSVQDGPVGEVEGVFELVHQTEALPVGWLVLVDEHPQPVAHAVGGQAAFFVEQVTGHQMYRYSLLLEQPDQVDLGGARCLGPGPQVGGLDTRDLQGLAVGERPVQCEVA
jgi:hypothetical protein